MPYDLFSVVVTGKSGFLEHLAEDKVSILWWCVRKKVREDGMKVKPCCPW